MANLNYKTEYEDKGYIELFSLKIFRDPGGPNTPFSLKLVYNGSNMLLLWYADNACANNGHDNNNQLLLIINNTTYINELTEWKSGNGYTISPSGGTANPGECLSMWSNDISMPQDSKFDITFYYRNIRWTTSGQKAWTWSNTSSSSTLVGSYTSAPSNKFTTTVQLFTATGFKENYSYNNIVSGLNIYYAVDNSYSSKTSLITLDSRLFSDLTSSDKTKNIKLLTNNFTNVGNLKPLPNTLSGLTTHIVYIAPNNLSTSWISQATTETDVVGLFLYTVTIAQHKNENNNGYFNAIELEWQSDDETTDYILIDCNASSSAQTIGLIFKEENSSIKFNINSSETWYDIITSGLGLQKISAITFIPVCKINNDLKISSDILSTLQFGVGTALQIINATASCPETVYIKNTASTAEIRQILTIEFDRQITLDDIDNATELLIGTSSFGFIESYLGKNKLEFLNIQNKAIGQLEISTTVKLLSYGVQYGADFNPTSNVLVELLEKLTGIIKYDNYNELIDKVNKVAKYFLPSFTELQKIQEAGLYGNIADTNCVNLVKQFNASYPNMTKYGTVESIGDTQQLQIRLNPLCDGHELNYIKDYTNMAINTMDTKYELLRNTDAFRLAIWSNTEAVLYYFLTEVF